MSYKKYVTGRFFIISLNSKSLKNLLTIFQYNPTENEYYTKTTIALKFFVSYFASVLLSVNAFVCQSALFATELFEWQKEKKTER